ECRAEVIKIEHPERGDDTRSWGPPFAPYAPTFLAANGCEKALNGQPGESAYFLCVNRNKRSVAIDIKSEAGRQIILDLVKKSD
ncbi:hypothetical protein EV182_008143, partial [Spiromyces aspiralis]